MKKGARNFFLRLMRPFISRQLKSAIPLRSGPPLIRFSVKEPQPVHPFFLRHRESSLVHVCPRFPNSVAPILFHLPDRTISRVIETIPPHIIGPTFVLHGRCGFGLDEAAVRSVIPRWSPIKDRKKAQKHMEQLSDLLCRKVGYIPEEMLTEIIQVAGSLRSADLISESMANEILRTVLPACLDKLNLSRQDVFNILYGLNRIRISSDNAVLFPLIAHFTHWYLGRNKLNRLKRMGISRMKRSIDTIFISS